MAGLNWFSAIFNPILDPVFGILLKLPPFFGIFIITLIVTSITIIVYKKMTNQSDLQRILNQLLDFYNGDKMKLIKFCVSRGHQNKEIAECLGVSEAYISKLISRYKLQETK